MIYTEIKIHNEKKSPTIKRIVKELIKDAWIEKEMQFNVIVGNHIHFLGGLFDSKFLITVNDNGVTVESDSEFEAVLISELIKKMK